MKKRITFLSLVGIALLAVAALLMRLERKRCSPEQVETICTPVLEWLKAEHERTGSYPQRLPSQFRSILKSIPFNTEYDPFIGKNGESMFCLHVGDYGEWPHPLYGLYWHSKAKEWSWSSDWPISEEERRDLLTNAGYYDHPTTTSTTTNQSAPSSD